MPETIVNWLTNHVVEILGALLGIVYIILSIRQNILTWPVGLLTSALYIWVFFRSKFYADMSLQVYYVAVSLYGWYYWLKGGNKQEERVELSVVNTPVKLFLPLILVTLFLFVLIGYVLSHYTDSPVVLGDALTTALSLTATWMLARKYLEHWLVWIVADMISLTLYLYKGLWPTVILFVVYTGMAVAGFRLWKKDMQHRSVQEIKCYNNP
ncbi:MAG: nicotinamide riboside transporter PnuC [Mangrovibacterium sp.]